MIEIKNTEGQVLFISESAKTIKEAVEAAVCKNISLYRANLQDANLQGANLQDADLRGTNLRGTNLRGTNLQDANLTKADLQGANLQDADLTEANLHKVNLRVAKNIPYIPMACPSDGAFIGWKKVNDCLVQLEIPADARRSSATARKCRCDKAKVLGIVHLRTDKPQKYVLNYRYPDRLIYEVGRMVYPDSFDEDRWNECSHGIHFFVNMQDAINYEY